MAYWRQPRPWYMDRSTIAHQHLAKEGALGPGRTHSPDDRRYKRDFSWRPPGRCRRAGAKPSRRWRPKLALAEEFCQPVSLTSRTGMVPRR